MFTIAISGISGKMGTEIYACAQKNNIDIACGIDKKSFSKLDCPIYKDFSQVKEKIDVLIDFSSPQLCLEAINFAATYKCKLVCGTTALSSEHLASLEELSKCQAVFYQENFCEPVFSLIKAAECLNNRLIGFDIEIIEEHGKAKKDAPSGTAKLLAKALNNATVHSLRGGNTPGTHTVNFYGFNQKITISHTAYSRSVFAEGAIKAALFIAKKDSGLYGMNELIEQTINS